ncbi:unnamed protein product [Sphagnum jensenii]|uniref:CRAL-TRIO domain-containing protein n=1 Tax=Sphagnum jensenii TaxID=128206 RepID=A0ABP1AL65_9BRYO
MEALEDGKNLEAGTGGVRTGNGDMGPGAMQQESVLMRDLIAKLDPPSKDVDDATLKRFLRARSNKVEKAGKMFAEHQKWRRTFVPLGYIPEEEVKNELEAKKVFLQGHDKVGRSLGVILACKHDAYKRNYEEFKRKYPDYLCLGLCFFLKPGHEKFTVILDLKGLKYKNLDPRGWISIFDFLQAYYPERLGRLFIVHVPIIFWGAWKIVNPFIDKVTKEKIIFVDEKKIESILLEEIEKDQIPETYGGTLGLVPIQDAPTPNWPPRS